MVFSSLVNEGPHKTVLNHPISRFYTPLQDDNKARVITHYHYEGWPDHGVPDTPTSMIAFARRAFSDNTSGKRITY